MTNHFSEDLARALLFGLLMGLLTYILVTSTRPHQVEVTVVCPDGSVHVLHSANRPQQVSCPATKGFLS